QHHRSFSVDHTLGAFAGEPVIELDIVALGPAEFMEPLPESRKVALPDFIVLGKAHDHADAPHPLALPRASRERPRSRRAAEQRDQLATFHSITSSATASNLSEISRPRVFAVLRLITRSNLVGCTTGKSAGFSPLSTRPT